MFLLDKYLTQGFRSVAIKKMHKYIQMHGWQGGRYTLNPCFSLPIAWRWSWVGIFTSITIRMGMDSSHLPPICLMELSQRGS